MSEVFIVGRTKMGEFTRCIGGIDSAGRPLRLLDVNGENFKANSPLQVGHVWDLSFRAVANVEPPHVEDVIVHQMRFVRDLGDPSNLVAHLPQAWEGGIDAIFDGLIRTTKNGSGYISARAGIPRCSTGFWLPDNDLVLEDDRSHYSYGQQCRLKYVGEVNPVAVIPAYSVVRVSLARWWRPPNADAGLEERCYLQLSGWLHLNEPF